MKNINRILTILLVVIGLNANAKTFSVGDLTQPALSTDCLDYCVDGACFWLVCGFWGCKVKTTPHINHNLPDFVVSSYNQAGDNAFKDIQSYDVSSDIAGGHLSSEASKNKNRNLKFKEVSIIGNPVAYAMGQSKYVCDSKIKPYVPYYLSTLDEKMWRSGLSEMIYPSSWIPGIKEIGKPWNSWGSLYPRRGMLNQSNEVKAASVIAARGLEIMTEGGLHIYQPADCGGNDKQKCNGLKKEGKWQMVSPKKENQCTAFGKESVEQLQGKIDDDGQYGWTAWRNYGCCIPRSGFFIGSVITGCLN